MSEPQDPKPLSEDELEEVRGGLWEVPMPPAEPMGGYGDPPMGGPDDDPFSQ